MPIENRPGQLGHFGPIEAPHGDIGSSHEHSSRIFAPGAHREIWEKAHPDIQKRAQRFTERIVERATHGKSPEAQARIEKAANEIVTPGIGEAMTIAVQIATPEYRGSKDGTTGFIPELSRFLNGIDQRGKVCADLRGSLLAYGAYPSLYNMTRTAGAQPNTVESDTPHGYRSGNIDHRSAIRTSIRRRRISTENQQPQFVYYTGPHFDSQEPTALSCAANKAQIESTGGLAEIDMRQGGIQQWYEAIGERFFAYDDEVRSQGGTSTTFDISLDTNNQRIIAGLRQAHRFFDPKHDLHTNVDRLARHGQIITSDQVLDMFQGEIDALAAEFGMTETINFFDYTQYSKNLMLIGNVAKAVTEQQERKNAFDWIPLHLLLDQSTNERINDNVKRAFAFSMISNAVYRRLTGVGAGDKNPLKHHPETMLRVGPIGADYNVRTVALVQGTPGGELRPQDVASARTLSNVLHDNLDHLGYGSAETARVIRVTGVVDLHQASKEGLLEQLDGARAQVERNLEIITPAFERGIQNGSVLLFGTIHDKQTRLPVDVVTI